MTEAEITEVIQGLHPDLKVGEMELRVMLAIAEAERKKCAKAMLGAVEAQDAAIKAAVAAERERCAGIAEIEHMTPRDIARVIRSNWPSD